MSKPQRQEQQTQRLETQEVHETPKTKYQHQLADVLIENNIFLLILGFAFIGVLTVFRKKILKWLGVEITRAKK